MDNIQIFNNPEFGQIRTIIIDGEPWFVGRDIALKLGYAKPQNALKDNIEEGDARKQGIPDANNHIQQMIIINEAGLYSLIFGSKLESAKKFKKWVTSEVLPSIRKTGTYGLQLPKTTLELLELHYQAIKEVNDKVNNVTTEVKSVKDELQEFKDSLPLLPEDADQISAEVKKHGVKLLGGKDAPAYQNRSLRATLYRDYYGNLKHNFNNITTYKAIKRSEKAKALEVVIKYEPPLFLKEQIMYENGQQMLDLEARAI